MIYYLRVDTPHALCGRLQTVAAQSYGKLYMIPYNHYEPEKSDWWLSPTSASPAYRHTKYYFGYDQDEDGGRTGRLIAGLHAEKGLGEVTRDVYTGARGASWIMTKEWDWHRFVKLVKGGKLQRAIAAASTALGQPITLDLQVGHAPDPQSGSDPESLLRAKDRAVYRYDPASEGLCLAWPVQLPQGVLKNMPERLNSEVLAGRLEELAKNPWVWVDCFICAQFRPYTEAAPPDQVWDTERVWTDYLKTFAYAIG
jgi:hypothetical protein